MPTQNPDPEGFGQGTKYLAMGFRFAGGTVLFLLLGLGVDRWLHLTPFGTVIGAILGATLSTLSVYRELVAESENRPAGRRWRGRRR